MNIRNVPAFLKENGRPELAEAVQSRFKGRKETSREDRFETEALMGFLAQNQLSAPTSEELILSPDFAYLQNLAAMIRHLEGPEIVIDLKEVDIVP
jgi:hypothetical protein